jgi:hypothetical protein
MEISALSEAVENFFTDTDRAAEETLDGLYVIRDQVDIMIAALESDLEEE